MGKTFFKPGSPKLSVNGSEVGNDSGRVFDKPGFKASNGFGMGGNSFNKNDDN